MKSFKFSHHAKRRHQQRGYRLSDLAFVAEHGSTVRDGILLTSQDVLDLERSAKDLIARAHRLENTFMPTADDTVKTVFKATRRQAKRRLRN